MLIPSRTGHLVFFSWRFGFLMLALIGLVIGSCGSEESAPEVLQLDKLMAGFEYAGSVPWPETELERFHPGNPPPIPQRLEWDQQYIFFHQLPADNDRLFDFTIAPRLTSAGFTISRPVVDDAGPILQFTGPGCAGACYARSHPALWDDPATRAEWKPYLYIVGICKPRKVSSRD